MSNLSFKAKYKVICEECSRDEFEQVGDDIQCSQCGRQYKRPDNLHIEPFDIQMDKTEEH